MGWLWRGMVRAVLLLVGVHGAMLLVRGDGAWRGMWFGLSGLPVWVEAACELALGAAAVWRRPVVRGWVAMMAAVALADTIRVWSLTPVPPLSLGLATALAAWALWPPRPRPWKHEAPAVALALFAAPLLWIACFGSTDYRAPADVAVVLGAKAYPGGRTSPALTDRVRTGIALYRAGLVRALVMSGGPGEPEAMERLARSHGVPAAALIADPAGHNTRATARNLAELSRRHGWRRVLAVSHGYHLTRVKIACLQEGIDVRTVPCRETFPPADRWRQLGRECAGFYAYVFGLDGARS